MSDLHTRLLAAVQQRMDVARVADGECWHVEYCGDSMGSFHDQNDPATIVRHCERDLRVLERHDRMPGILSAWVCRSLHNPIVRGLCAEILDLAAAYGVDVDGG